MIYVTTLLAIAAIIGQGIVCLLLLRFAKTFGAYSEDYRKMTLQLMATQESYMTIHEGHQRMLEELRSMRTVSKGAA